MRIEITEEHLKELKKVEQYGKLISKKSKMFNIDGYDILFGKTSRKIIKKYLRCKHCNKVANYMNISDCTINVSEYVVHHINFQIDDAALGTIHDCNNAVVCSKCRNDYIIKNPKPDKRTQREKDEDERLQNLWYEYKDAYQSGTLDAYYDKQSKAEHKNRKLVKSLNISRENFCGLGTRKVKLRLNKLIKQNNKDAEILRTLLELEDVNINAKKYVGDYKQHYYDKKSELLKKVIELYRENNLVYGFQKSNDYSCNYVLYFEFNDVQFSWHSNSTYNAPKYSKEWDGLQNSTLGKLEKLISGMLENI